MMEHSPFNSEFKDFLLLALEKCLQTVGARSGSIFLFDKQKNELILEVAQNARGLRLEGVRQKVGEGVSGRVAKHRSPLLVEDVHKFEYLRGSPTLKRYDTKSFISVPFECSGDLIGVINITDRYDDVAFTSEDLSTVFNVCTYLGLAVYSIKKYFEEQKGINAQLLDELNALKKSLEHSKSYSSLGKLSSGLVHELNNPLDGIIRYVNLALDRSNGDGIVHEYLREAKEGLNRIAKIVRSLLDFSWSLSKSSNYIDVNCAIQESLFTTHDFLASYNVTVEKHFADNLPMVSDYRLKVVFINIIKNACSAMGVQGGRLSISTRFKDGYLEILFADSGPGVPEKLREKIFEPFFTTKGIGEGTGLGLAICHETVQRYGGTISVQNSKLGGACFVIRLPVFVEESALPEASLMQTFPMR